jgi:hypothetical protein
MIYKDTSCVVYTVAGVGVVIAASVHSVDCIEIVKRKIEFLKNYKGGAATERIIK